VHIFYANIEVLILRNC